MGHIQHLTVQPNYGKNYYKYQEVHGDVDEWLHTA